MTFTEVVEAAKSLNVVVGPPAPAPPNAETKSAINVEGHSAVGTGYVDPNGGPTNFRFDYGLTPAYGSSSPSYAAGSGFDPEFVTGVIPDLLPASTYHYRIAAVNQAGEAKGGDSQFTTPPVAPTTALTFVDISPGQAHLKGTVNPGGAATSWSFEWGTTEAYGASASGNAGSGISDVPVDTVAKAGIKGGTKYLYRLRATNSFGGDEAKGTFTTPDWHPHIESQGVVNVHRGEAFLTSGINPSGFPTSYHYEFGETEAYGTSVPVPDAEVGDGETTVYGLAQKVSVKGETTYHFRTVATNLEGSSDAGTKPGADKKITTPDWRPAVVTLAATKVRDSRATLRGTVNPNGFATNYQFEFGPTTSYGSSVPVPAETAGSGEADVPVAFLVSGLEPDSSYHYRLRATNQEGTHFSEDGDFRTRRPTTMCAEEEWPQCGSEHQYAGETPIEAHLVPGSTAIIATAGLSVECASSALQGRTGSAAGTPMEIEVESVSFSECASLGILAASVSPMHLPYDGGLLYGEGEGEGKMEWVGSGGPVGMTVDYGFVQIHCGYGGEELSAELFGGSPAVIQAEAALTLEEGDKLGYCGEVGGNAFVAEYELATPDPVFPSAAPDVVLCEGLEEGPCSSVYPGGMMFEAELSQKAPRRFPTANRWSNAKNH